MPEIHLTGLRAPVLLGYRATMGLMQVLQELPGLEATRLSWSKDYYPHAVLHTESVELGGLVDRLEEFYATRLEDPRWGFSGVNSKGKVNHRVSIERYQEVLREYEDRHPHAVAWLQGTCTDQVRSLRGKEDKVYCADPTKWDTCGGGSRTSVFSKALEVLSAIAKRKDRREAILRTLQGPWMRDAEITPMGWDTRQISSNAKLGTSTANLSKTTDLMAMVFALESLALYPVNAQNGKSRTAGTGGKYGNQVSWATWQNPVSFDTVVAILDYPELHREKDDLSRETLKVLGFSALYRCFFQKDANTQEYTWLLSRSLRVG